MAMDGWEGVWGAKKAADLEMREGRGVFSLCKKALIATARRATRGPIKAMPSGPNTCPQKEKTTASVLCLISLDHITFAVNPSLHHQPPLI